MYPAKSRLRQIAEWLGGADYKGECLIVLDECHKAKNLVMPNGGERTGMGRVSRSGRTFHTLRRPQC
jgi:hypothetical protein